MSYVDAAGLNTYYEVRGAGDPVVMLHGGFATIETWEAQAAALAERYRVYLPERRGHGRTPDVDGPLTYENMAADTAAFIEALGIGPAHLVGWSDGASVALYVALHRPELVRKVICMGAPAWFDGYTPAMKAMVLSLSLDHMPPSMVEAHRDLSPDGPDHLPVFFEKLAAMWTSEPQMTVEELSPAKTAGHLGAITRAGAPPRSPRAATSRPTPARRSRRTHASALPVAP